LDAYIRIAIRNAFIIIIKNIIFINFCLVAYYMPIGRFYLFHEMSLSFIFSLLSTDGLSSACLFLILSLPSYGQRPLIDWLFIPLFLHMSHEILVQKIHPLISVWMLIPRKSLTSWFLLIIFHYRNWQGRNWFSWWGRLLEYQRLLRPLFLLICHGKL